MKPVGLIQGEMGLPGLRGLEGEPGTGIPGEQVNLQIHEVLCFTC